MMRYLAFVEWNREDAERISELWKQLEDERAKAQITFQKHYYLVFTTYRLSYINKKTRDVQALWIFETDNQMHLINLGCITHPTWISISFQ